MDIISDILRLIRFQSVVYFQHAFGNPWGMAIPDGGYAQFHYVVDGECKLLYNDDEVQLGPGDLVLFPHGHAHRLADKRGTACVPGARVIELLQRESDAPRDDGLYSSISDLRREESTSQTPGTTLLCGHYAFDAEARHPILSALPDLMHVRGRVLTTHADLRALMDMLVRDSTSDIPGSSVTSAKLAEVLFIKLLLF